MMHGSWVELVVGGFFAGFGLAAGMALFRGVLSLFGQRSRGDL
jgi:hypothetical protein